MSATILKRIVITRKASFVRNFVLQTKSENKSVRAESNISQTDNNCDSNVKLKMQGWQIHGYGDVSELQFSEKLKVPKIKSSDECLVRVTATSVNPIDVAMLGGYASTLLNAMRCTSEIEFPLTLGREFCGELVQQGFGGCNSSKLDIGDRVWGVVPVHTPKGAHAEYVAVSKYCLAPAPSTLSDEEAAAVLYAGLTAWSGLYVTGGLAGIGGAINSTIGCGSNASNKRVLVLGGSGSVGSLAIQLLKAEGVQVLATCSEDAVEMVKAAGADIVFDYKNPEVDGLRNFAPYDIVLDCAGQGAPYAETLPFQYKQYITFSSPLVRNIDEAGMASGLLQNLLQLIRSNATSLSAQNGLIKWGFFAPAPQGIQHLGRLVERKKLLPNIDTVYKFDELPKAFEHVANGHLRGKIVIKIP